jgi:signal transduction histidine kinase
MLSDDRFVQDRLVLVLAQSSAFAQSLVARWQDLCTAPRFSIVTTAEGGSHNGSEYKACHLVIVEAAAVHSHRILLQRLDAVGTPVICALPVAGSRNSRAATRGPEPIVLSPTADQLRADFPRMLTLNLVERESGLDTLVTLAMEVLKRIEATLRAKKAESDAGSQSAQLALGKYVAESMHGFNNALTAVLGNAELLMLESSTLSSQMQEEVEAIHSNAIRLHEMMQRFSSLETEIEAGRKQGKSAAAGTSQAYLSGT